MKKRLVQLAFNLFFRRFSVPKNRISGTRSATRYHSTILLKNVIYVYVVFFGQSKLSLSFWWLTSFKMDCVVIGKVSCRVWSEKKMSHVLRQA